MKGERQKLHREENDSKNNTETQHAKERAMRGIQELPPVARLSPDTTLGAVLGGLGLASVVAIYFFAVKLWDAAFIGVQYSYPAAGASSATGFAPAAGGFLCRGRASASGMPMQVMRIAAVIDHV